MLSVNGKIMRALHFSPKNDILKRITMNAGDD